MTTSTTDLYRVAGVQMDIRLNDLPANRERMLARLIEAAGRGARLAVFPECALSGYCFASRAAALAAAEPIPGPTSRALAEVCARHAVYAVYGLLERRGEELYNACVLVGPEGVIGSYRKVHLPFLGVDRFTDPGNRPFEVHDAGGLKVGMHICYDGSFPETGRILALGGADLLVLPTNWPVHSECAAEHMIACRAMENTVYMIAVNRVGEEETFRFIGQTGIADPAGAMLARAGSSSEEIVYADLDPARARRKHLVRVPGKHEINRFADRRPAFYGPLVAGLPARGTTPAE